MNNNEKIKYNLISVADIDVKAPLELISLGEFKNRYPNGEKYPELPNDILGIVDKNVNTEGQAANERATFRFLMRNGYGIYVDKQ